MGTEDSATHKYTSQTAGPLPWCSASPGPVQTPLVGSPKALAEPRTVATESLQSPAWEHTIFGTCIANPKMHKYPNQSKVLHLSDGKTPKCITFSLFVSHFIFTFLLFQCLQSQFSLSDFAAIPVPTNSSQTGSPQGRWD